MDHLGPYHLVRRIGGGGMGVVHLAEDTLLGRRVALKVIAEHLAADRAFRTRFSREARALAALDSPHVVQVHAHGEDDGRLWIATQLVPDGDLGAALAAGPLPRSVAVDVVAQVARGLADAHAAGIVHRDLKPANVLLRRRPGGFTAYLSDFGIARLLGDHTRTRAGAVGTPAYMAPELHTGGEAGVASDVYALGCLLWTTVTGRPPYAAPTEYALACAHLESSVPQLPGRDPLNPVLRRALAKDPSRRHASAAEFAADLRAAASASSTGVRRWPLLVAAAVVVVAALPVGYAVARDDRPTSPAAPEPSHATDSLAAALADQGGLDPATARCTAERWMDAAGLDAMVAAGFFDEHFAYVDQGTTAMTPAIEAAARSAAAACASGAGVSRLRR